MHSPFCCHTVTPLAFSSSWIWVYWTNCRSGGNTQEQRAPVGSDRDNLDSVPIVLLLCHPCASRRCRESRSSYVIIQNRKVVWVVASRNRQGAKAMCEMKSMLTWQMLMLPLGTQDTQRICRVPHVGAWSHTAAASAHGPLGQHQPNPLYHYIFIRRFPATQISKS